MSRPVDGRLLRQEMRVVGFLRAVGGLWESSTTVSPEPRSTIFVIHSSMAGRELAPVRSVPNECDVCGRSWLDVGAMWNDFEGQRLVFCAPCCADVLGPPVAMPPRPGLFRRIALAILRRLAGRRG